jgi:hypothetical protein
MIHHSCGYALANKDCRSCYGGTARSPPDPYFAQRLERDWSGVANSILDGIDKILTVTRLGLPKELRRSLACTNMIENVMGTVRRVCRDVKRWRSASMAMRWTAAAMREAPPADQPPLDQSDPGPACLGGSNPCHRTRSWSAFTAVRRLAAHYKRSPDLLSEEEVRDYVLHLRDQRGVARGTFKPMAVILARPEVGRDRVTGSVMAYLRGNDMILLGCVGVSADGQ